MCQAKLSPWTLCQQANPSISMDYNMTPPLSLSSQWSLFIRDFSFRTKPLSNAKQRETLSIFLSNWKGFQLRTHSVLQPLCLDFEGLKLRFQDQIKVKCFSINSQWFSKDYGSKTNEFPYEHVRCSSTFQ